VLSGPWAAAQQGAAESIASAERWGLVTPADESVAGQGWEHSIHSLDAGAPPREYFARPDAGPPADPTTAGLMSCSFVDGIAPEAPQRTTYFVSRLAPQPRSELPPTLPGAPRGTSTRGGYFAASLCDPHASHCDGQFESLGPGRRAFLSPADSIPDLAAAGSDRYSLSLSASGHGADAPPGTMFIWSFARATSDSDGPTPGDGHTSDARQGSRAGFVLSRPLGLYSLDWVGVAITTTIH
jgi:hypothetical protein